MNFYCTYRITRAICFVAFKVCFRFRVKGIDNVPKEGPFIAAGNHVSYLDPIAVAVAVPRPLHFMARDTLFRVPIFGSYLRAAAIYPVKRGSGDLKAMKDSLRLLKQGNAIGMFPEGTRIPGPGFGKAEPGVGMLAARSGVPVVPVFIKGGGEAWPKRARFIKLRPMEARIGKPLKFEAHRDGIGRREAYQEFSDKIMESIALLA